LGCTPSDLIEMRYEQDSKPVALNETGPGIGALQPIRAKVRRPGE
jgi:hypothetical protein